MERYSQKSFYCVGAFLLVLLGASLSLVRPMLSGVAQDSRALQLWPDRIVGVSSGPLEGPAEYGDAQVLPFGVCNTVAGEAAEARTYLRFPLGVFPPGTEIVHAALHVYVDAGSGAGEATFGVYRALEPWEEEGWGDDRADWPALLASPIAVETARFDEATSLLPAPTPVALLASAFLKAPFLVSAFYDSPLSTPTSSSPLPTPTVRPTASPTPTPGPTATPGPTPTPSPLSTGSAVALGQARGAWIEWDVTALMRAWMAGEVDDYGLALAPAPDPDAGPEEAGDLLVAHWLAADDTETKPYIIAEFTVHPVTPTATPAPILPHAGGAVGWRAGGLLLVGAALLVLGLAVRRR